MRRSRDGARAAAAAGESRAAAGCAGRAAAGRAAAGRAAASAARRAAAAARHRRHLPRARRTCRAPPRRRAWVGRLGATPLQALGAFNGEPTASHELGQLAVRSGTTRACATTRRATS